LRRKDPSATTERSRKPPSVLRLCRLFYPFVRWGARGEGPLSQAGAPVRACPVAALRHWDRPVFRIHGILSIGALRRLCPPRGPRLSYGPRDGSRRTGGSLLATSQVREAVPCDRRDSLKYLQTKQICGLVGSLDSHKGKLFLHLSTACPCAISTRHLLTLVW
jgi:hypothetical protein